MKDFLQSAGYAAKGGCTKAFHVAGAKWGDIMAYNKHGGATDFLSMADFAGDMTLPKISKRRKNNDGNGNVRTKRKIYLCVKAHTKAQIQCWSTGVVIDINGSAERYQCRVYFFGRLLGVPMANVNGLNYSKRCSVTTSTPISS